MMVVMFIWPGTSVLAGLVVTRNSAQGKESFGLGTEILWRYLTYVQEI